MEFVPRPGPRSNLGLRFPTQLDDAVARLRGPGLALGELLEKLPDHGVERGLSVGGDLPRLTDQQIVQGDGDILHEHRIRETV